MLSIQEQHAFLFAASRKQEFVALCLRFCEGSPYQRETSGLIGNHVGLYQIDARIRCGGQRQTPEATNSFKCLTAMAGKVLLSRKLQSVINAVGKQFKQCMEIAGSL